jgi:hypothetical protein
MDMSKMDDDDDEWIVDYYYGNYYFTQYLYVSRIFYLLRNWKAYCIYFVVESK